MLAKLQLTTPKTLATKAIDTHGNQHILALKSHPTVALKLLSFNTTSYPTLRSPTVLISLQLTMLIGSREWAAMLLGIRRSFGSRVLTTTFQRYSTTSEVGASDSNDNFFNFNIFADVMGPDEDHPAIDNNGYTNVNAAFNLYFGDFAGCACKDVLRVTEADYENFAKVARSLAVLYDAEKDYHPQYEGYVEGTNIKQADAVLLGYPLQLPMAA